jgi:hypothetical protein
MKTKNCNRPGYLNEVTGAYVDEDFLCIVERSRNVEGRRERHENLLPCTPTTETKG